MNVYTYPEGTIARDRLTFSVIFARKDGKWLLCRHRERDTWEFPGGHIEEGETPPDCAQRELFEETGAKGVFTRIGDYGVERENGIRYGALFLCDIDTVSALPPCSEMAECRFFAVPPENMTYPTIQGPLYRHVQGFLNTITAPDEIWDILDENKQPTGRTHRRGDPLPAGDRHLVVDVWMQRKDGRFLLTRRAPTKGYPLMWETTGGSSASGESSLQAALREAQEEAGMHLNPQQGKLVYSYMRPDHFKDVWVFDHEAALDEVILQEGETVDARLATMEEILELYQKNELVPYTYLDTLCRYLSSRS